MDTLRSSIIRTLAYAAVFDYPLTYLEIHQYLIREKASLSSLMSQLLLMKEVEKDGEYYVLKGRSHDTVKRKLREVISSVHWEEARRVSQYLSCIPFIKYIGVSGSLSMNNSISEDDIDLFIITDYHSLWISRFFTTVALYFLGKKRKRDEKHPGGRICTNMWISADNLELRDKNLYAAHEVAQLKTLVNKDKIYERFLFENSWVNKYLPQVALPAKKTKDLKSALYTKKFFLPFEGLAYGIQRFYMRKALTRERVSLGEGKFHPCDVTSHVLRTYRKNCSHYLYADSKLVHKSITQGRLFHGIFASTITPGS